MSRDGSLLICNHKNTFQNEYVCAKAAEKALAKHGSPVMIHTDKGKQFLLSNAGAKISVGERGFKDNIVMERFWRSYKWEFVYLQVGVCILNGQDGS